MLTEAIIHLPIFDNDLRSLEAETKRMQSLLMLHFGGFTAHSCMGQWRDPETGKTFKEPVMRYMIAANWDEESTRDKLREIAEQACILMKQVCIYVVINGKADFVYARQDQVAA